MSSVAASLAAAAFAVIALVHAYWALGGLWPGHDAESLARTVVGGPPGMQFPGRAATWAVVAVLVGGAVTVLLAGRVVASPLPVGLARAASAVGAAVLLVRGVEGFVDVRLRPDTAGSAFARLNVVLYSPLCLVLALLTALAVR